MESQGRAIVELWRMFLRQFWLLLTISVTGAVLTVVIAFILPPIYESEARILVESQQIPDELARSTVTTGAAERLQLIEQRLMTRDNLLTVLEDQELFIGRTDLTLSEKIQALRDATKIRPIALKNTARRGRLDLSISAFTISVRFDDAVKASNIANDFVTKVLDQNSRARTERATETVDYFESEEKDLASKLTEIEIEITNFKNENEDALPNSLDFRRAEVTRLASAEFDLDRRLLELEEQRSSLEIQLAQLREAPDTELDAPPSNEEAELKRLESQLAQKRAVFSESHREIRALKAQINALEAGLPESGKKVGDSEMASLRLRTAEATIQRRMELLITQTDLVQTQKADITKRKRTLEASIAKTPEVEIELNGLNRRYLDLQEQYDQSVNKRAFAETGEKLEVNQQAERFEIIENALVPDKPVAPDRRRIMILGTGMSIALAFAVAFLVEVLNPAMRTAAQMERALDLRPVATIPYIRTKRERRLRIIRIVVVTLIFGIGAPTALWAVDTYYLPLQILIDRFIDQAGLEGIVRLVGTIMGRE